MRTMKIFILPLCFLCLTFLSGCGQPCSSELVQTFKSNDGKILIWFEKKNCGATTDFVYELKSINREENKDKLIFQFDSGNRIDWPDDDKKIFNLSWRNGSQMVLELQVPVRIFYESSKLNNVPITYRYKAETTRI